MIKTIYHKLKITIKKWYNKEIIVEKQKIEAIARKMDGNRGKMSFING